MIRKQEILERAAEWNLRPEVVEKDYVLGWLLAAASRDEVVRADWVLKGGTCVKKCFFETYRFSEDLDFSLLPSAQYDEASISQTLHQLGDSAGTLSGIRFSPDHVAVKARHDKLGRKTFEGRIGYQGPLAVPSWPRVLFDLTQHEPILLTPVHRPVIHPYSDNLPNATAVRTYAFEELLAEKARALFERTRPRDLYDVAFILDNLQDPLDTSLVSNTFERKCAAKQFQAPSAVAIVARARESEELRVDWDVMLAHQLPHLPPIEGALDRLENALSWLAERPAQILGTSARLPVAPMAAAGGRVAPLRITGGALEQLRFAGANRLLVAFNYHAKHRIVEPYSLRWAESTGNLNFYGWELATGQIKCFTISKMSNVQVLSRTFTPRYHVELGERGTITRGAWRW